MPLITDANWRWIRERPEFDTVADVRHSAVHHQVRGLELLVAGYLLDGLALLRLEDGEVLEVIQHIAGLQSQQALLIKRESASHWYLRDRKPFHEVERADGKGLRPVTLRDTRKVRAYPSR